MEVLFFSNHPPVQNIPMLKTILKTLSNVRITLKNIVKKAKLQLEAQDNLNLPISFPEQESTKKKNSAVFFENPEFWFTRRTTTENPHPPNIPSPNSTLYFYTTSQRKLETNHKIGLFDNISENLEKPQNPMMH